tara:strand:- start:372 stop:488 length:117 start_codon:yes stop_codon:yes gene_type:complete
VDGEERNNGSTQQVSDCFNNAGKKIKINKILGTRGVLR